MDENLKLNLLFDFYGDLLTERQKEVFRYYYQEDLSLGEIAEQCGVTRQAVYDLLKRAAATLEEMESRLRLVGKYLEKKEKLRAAGKIIARLKESHPAARDELDVLARLMTDLLQGDD